MLAFHARLRSGNACACARRSSGFTLVELMITIAVLAVVLAIGFPTFTYVSNSSRLSSVTNEMVASLQMARMDAIRLSGSVKVCASDDGATCRAGAGDWTQWITLADTDRDGAMDDLLRVNQARVPVQVLVSPAITSNEVVYSADGLSRKGAALLKGRIAICLPVTTPADNVREVSIVSGSRISTKSQNKAGACAAPSNPT